MPHKIATVTKGACPYCGESTLQVSPEERKRPDEIAMLCCNATCLRYCTKTNGQFYPHDECKDPLSPIAKMARFE